MTKDLSLSNATVFLFKLHCVYPDKQITLNFYIRCSFVVIFFQYILVGSLGHAITHTMKYGLELEALVNDGAYILASLTSTYCQLVYILNINKAKVLRKSLGDFTYFRKPRRIEKVDLILNKIARSFYLYYIFMAWMLFYGLVIEKCEEGVENNCGLIVVAWMPYEVYSSPGRQITYILQIFCGFGNAMLTFFISLLDLNFSEHLIAYYHELKCMLREIPQIPQGPERRTHFRNCMEYHQRILVLGDMLESLCSQLFIVHVTTCPIIISTIGFQLLLFDFDPIVFGHGSAWFWAALTACIFGQRLVNQSESTSDAAFEAIPFDGDNKIALDLSLVIMRCRKPLTIPTGKFFICCHALFVGIIKSAYSFLALFSQSVNVDAKENKN